MTSREFKNLPQETKKILTGYLAEYPVKLGKIANELGVSIKVSTMKTGISGQIKREEGGYVIRVNRHESRDRQRFTIAHELSHFLLHRDIIDASPSGIEDNVLYRSGAPESIEYQANRLAADIVMPMDQVERVLNEEFNGVVVDRTIEGLAARFGVSKAAMEVRLSTFASA